MSIQAVAWALDQDLPARPKLVLVSIANHANHTDGYCWLKADTIGGEASCSARAVYRFVGDLIRNGYIRKQPRRGDDGRQRANDYWILFNRPEAPWVAVGPVDSDADSDAEPIDEESEGDSAAEQVSDETDAQDVVKPTASLSHGNSPPPTDSGVARQPVDLPALSCGPTDSGVSHTDTAEPSKTNPEKGGLRTGPPRRYRPPPPPPPQPVGATTLQGTGELVFVFFPSRAYDAWKLVKEFERGRPFNIKTMREGKWGWYFPSVFPPEDLLKAAQEAKNSFATKSELDEFAKTG